MEKATAKEITAIVLPNGENIPTFDAYLKLVASKPNTRLILEMKSLSDYNREDLAAKKIVKQLKKYGVLDQTEIIAPKSTTSTATWLPRASRNWGWPASTTR